MILTTTPTIEGQPIKQYLGIITGETIIGANAIKDFMAGLTDFFGGRSSELQQRASQKGANAIVGIDLDYETVGANGGMLMVTVSGTAVVI